MARRPRASARPLQSSLPGPRGQCPLIDEVPAELLKADIDQLPPGQRLVDSGGLEVYWAHAAQLRQVLREIGRLRELTFRAVGEGSGKSADIDAFDSYYLHLFVWDARARKIVGAYRLGLVQEILSRYGKRGLYTHSLFRYGPQILDMLEPAIELGRSFVRPEYQRGFAPMLLLWRGIARFIEACPQFAVLFGPVSISNSYSGASRELIVEYLSAHAPEPRMVRHVQPRRPFRHEPRASGLATPVPDSLEELSRMIAAIEPDRKGIPILLRQYLRLGGRIIGFNVDDAFGNVLDGLLVVDLRDIDSAVLERYMGRPAMIAFRAYHALECEFRQCASGAAAS